MKAVRNNTNARPGFTLIELLIVMLIIAILMSLLLSAYSKVIDLGNSTRNMGEIKQLETALVNFTATYTQVPGPPPSRIKLCSLLSQYDMTQALDRDSVVYLRAMFPGIEKGTPWTSTGIDWTGCGGTLPVTLEGDQCLVFFLGGIPISGSTPGCAGFYSDNTNPALLTGTGRSSPGLRIQVGAVGFDSRQ